MLGLFWSYLPTPLLLSLNQKFDVTRLMIVTSQTLYLNALILKLKRVVGSQKVQLKRSCLLIPLLFLPNKKLDFTCLHSHVHPPSFFITLVDF